MRKLPVVIAALAVVLTIGFAVSAQTPKPKHINRAIELLEQGQPIYYTGSHSGTEGSFEHPLGEPVVMMVVLVVMMLQTLKQLFQGVFQPLHCMMVSARRRTSERLL